MLRLQHAQHFCSSEGMCGRFGASYRDIKTVWNLYGNLSFQTRYNIAPSQEVPVIIRNEGHNEAKVMKWGLVPSWAPDSSMGQRMINARSERCWKSHHSNKPYSSAAALFRRMVFMTGTDKVTINYRSGFSLRAESLLRFQGCGITGLILKLQNRCTPSR